MRSRTFPGIPFSAAARRGAVVQQLPRQQREIAKRLESQARRLGHADAVAHVVTGDAAAGIVSAASEASADVIVMGVAPRTWLTRSIFRSTLGSVLRKARIPVLIIPVLGGEEEWSDTTIVEGAMEGVPSSSATARIAA